MVSKTPPAPLSVWRPINIDTFLLGAPHYPEHVDESYWERDAERMAAAGFNTVRLGEFAWHIFESREGTFDFDLFDRAIEVLGRHGIKTIMCTPTATPPRWLTANYPEVQRWLGLVEQLAGFVKWIVCRFMPLPGLASAH